MQQDLLSAEYQGAVAQYGDALLFIGFDLGDGVLQITVYPGYRFPGDDRVHGHIGIFDVPLDTPWPEIMRQVDDIEQQALQNYRRASRMRAGYLGGRRRGAMHDAGVEHIAEKFRESWAGFSLQLARKGEVVRGDVRFSGQPDRAFAASWNGRRYTVRVFDTGSMVVVPGDVGDRDRPSLTGENLGDVEDAEE